MKKIKDFFALTKDNIAKRSIVIAVIFLVLITSIVCLNKKPIKEKDVFENLLISSDVSLVETKEICPNSDYKTCLPILLIKKESTLNQQFEKLIKDLTNTKKTRENLNYSVSTEKYDPIIDTLKRYKESWNTYKRVACELQNVGSLSGSGYDDFINICILNEIQKFSLQLSEIDKDYNWIPKE